MYYSVLLLNSLLWCLRVLENRKKKKKKKKTDADCDTGRFFKKAILLKMTFLHCIFLSKEINQLKETLPTMRTK